MRCVVTGAGGYLARFVIDELEQEHDLTLFSRDAIKTSHEVVTGNFLTARDCRKALAGAEVVVHLGAIPEPSPGTFAVNSMSTYRILEAARQSGVRRIVMASSNCVYGHCYRSSGSVFLPLALPIDEGHPSRPEDTYGLSKVVGEEILAAFVRGYGLEAAALRLAWVWGDREHEWWLTQGHADLERYGEGLWAYIDARDAARAFRLAVEAEVLPAETAYNINALDTMSEMGSATLAREYLPHLGHLADSLSGRDSFFSSERARAVLGWVPHHSWLERKNP